MTLPVPTQRTWSVGDIVTAAEMNANVRDAVNFLLGPPLFIGYGVAVQSIPNNAFTVLALDTEAVDTYNGHSTVSNNSRYTAQVAGWYLCVGAYAASSNATGQRVVGLQVNGASVVPVLQSQVSPNSTSTTIIQAVGTLFLNVGDYVETRAIQVSGAALNTAANACWMSCLWIHS